MFAQLKRGVALLLAFCAFSFELEARANPSSRLVYVRGAGAEECPDEEALRTAVATRLGYDPFHAFASTTIFAEVKRVRENFGAEVKLVDEHGIERGSRHLEAPGRDCADVIGAMALTISIIIDPLSLTGPRPPAAAEPEPALPPETPPPPPETPPPGQATLTARPALPRPQKTDRAALFIGAGGLASLGMAPSVAAGVAAFGGVRWPHLSLALDTRIDLPSSGASTSGARVRSNVLLASLVSCAHLGTPFACLLVAVGSLHATSDAQVQRTAAALYSAIGARIGVALPLGSGVDLRPYVDTLLNLRRYTLQISGADAFTFSAWSANAGLAVSVQF